MKKIMIALYLLVASAVTHAEVSYNECMHMSEVGIMSLIWRDDGIPYAESLSRFMDDETGHWAPHPDMRSTASGIIYMVYSAPELENATARDMEMMAFAICNI